MGVGLGSAHPPAHAVVHAEPVGAVERRVGEDEVEAARDVVRVVVVAVDVAAVFDFAFEAVDSEVQAAQAAGFVGFLDAVDGDLRGGVMHLEMHDVASVEKPPANGAG